MKNKLVNLKIGRNFKVTANLEIPMLWFGDLKGRAHSGLLTGSERKDLKKLRRMIDLVLNAKIK